MVVWLGLSTLCTGHMFMTLQPSLYELQLIWRSVVCYMTLICTTVYVALDKTVCEIKCNEMHSAIFTLDLQVQRTKKLLRHILRWIAGCCEVQQTNCLHHCAIEVHFAGLCFSLQKIYILSGFDLDLIYQMSLTGKESNLYNLRYLLIRLTNPPSKAHMQNSVCSP